MPGSFCVNVLSDKQSDLCWKFAKSGTESTRFDGVAMARGPVGCAGARAGRGMDRLRGRARLRDGRPLLRARPGRRRSTPTPTTTGCHRSRSCSTGAPSVGSRPRADTADTTTTRAGFRADGERLSEMNPIDRRTPLAAGLDTFAVVLFVAIGRREHEEDSAISGLINTAAPFLIALAIALAGDCGPGSDRPSFGPESPSGRSWWPPGCCCVTSCSTTERRPRSSSWQRCSSDSSSSDGASRSRRSSDAAPPLHPGSDPGRNDRTQRSEAGRHVRAV